MKTVMKVFLFLLVLLFLATPVMAMGVSPQEVDFDPFAVMKGIFVALSAAVGFGSALTFLIQLGKMYAPKMFPDSSAQNWRLGSILVITLVIYLVPLFFPETISWLTVARLDKLAGSFAEFGALNMPLFILLADWISKKFYQNTLRGTALGYSHSNLPAMKIKSK